MERPSPQPPSSITFGTYPIITSPLSLLAASRDTITGRLFQKPRISAGRLDQDAQTRIPYHGIRNKRERSGLVNLVGGARYPAPESCTRCGRPGPLAAAGPPTPSAAAAAVTRPSTPAPAALRVVANVAKRAAEGQETAAVPPITNDEKAERPGL